MPRISVAKVELYNICERGRAIANGYQVGRYLVDGNRRCQTLRQFGRDQDAARSYAELWNGENHAK